MAVSTSPIRRTGLAMKPSSHSIPARLIVIIAMVFTATCPGCGSSGPAVIDVPADNQYQVSPEEREEMNRATGESVKQMDSLLK